jgi:formate dehydrogenase subunit delta
MANQIATFFKTQPGTAQAESVANHLRDFWEPRMREKLLTYIKDSGKGLDPVVLQAAQKL